MKDLEAFGGALGEDRRRLGIIAHEPDQAADDQERAEQSNDVNAETRVATADVSVHLALTGAVA